VEYTRRQERGIQLDTSYLIDVGRILLGLVLNTVILLMLVYRMADLPAEVRKTGTVLLVVFATLVWWLADDKHGRMFGELTVVSVIPVLFLFTKPLCRIDWDVAHKVAAIFLVVFSIVVIGLGRGADALAPQRTRLTVQFHRMLDRDAGVPDHRPSFAEAIAQFHRSMDAARGKITDMVTRKKAREKLQTGLGAILKEQRERQRLMEEAGYGDLMDGNSYGGEINLTGSLKEISTQFDGGMSLLKGIKAAQDAGSEEDREEAMLKYREKITAERMSGSKSSLPDSSIPGHSETSIEELARGVSRNSGPAQGVDRRGPATEGATRTTEATRSTTGTGRAAGASASKSGFSIVPDVESEAPSETMIDSEWSAKPDQIAWADSGGDSAEPAVSVRLTTYDEHEGLQGLTQGGTAGEWRSAHKKLKVSGVMKSDDGGYVVLIGSDLHYPGDLVNVTQNGTSYWWRLKSASKNGVAWDPAGFRAPGEVE